MISDFRRMQFDVAADPRRVVSLIKHVFKGEELAVSFSLINWKENENEKANMRLLTANVWAQKALLSFLEKYCGVWKTLFSSRRTIIDGPFVSIVPLIAFNEKSKVHFQW